MDDLISNEIKIEKDKVYSGVNALINSNDNNDVLLRVTVERVTRHGLSGSAYGMLLTDWGSDLHAEAQQAFDEAMRRLDEEDSKDVEDATTADNYDAYVDALERFAEAAKDRIDELGLAQQHHEVEAAKQAFLESGEDATEEEEATNG